MVVKLGTSGRVIANRRKEAPRVLCSTECGKLERGFVGAAGGRNGVGALLVVGVVERHEHGHGRARQTRDTVLAEQARGAIESTMNGHFNNLAHHHIAAAEKMRRSVGPAMTGRLYHGRV